MWLYSVRDIYVKKNGRLYRQAADYVKRDKLYNKKSEYASDRNFPTEDYYLWEGDEIVGISAYGEANRNNITAIVLPERCKSVQPMALYRYDSTGLHFFPALQKLIIPKNIKNITSTFIGYYPLRELYISDGVESLAYNAFPNSLLNSIEIPTTMYDIAENAFNYWSGLTSIKVRDGSNFYDDIDGVLFNKDFSVVVRHPEGKGGTYTIPDSVSEVGNYAFYRCLGLSMVNLNADLERIGSYAFYNCTGLQDIDLNTTNVRKIGANAFYYCSRLSKLVIPDSVEEIGSNVFAYCTGLTNVTLSNNLKIISDYAFSNCSKLGAIVIPDGVEKIDGFAFNNCTSLATATIPDSVREIGKRAFYSTGLTTLPNLNGVTTLGDNAFASTKISIANIPDTVTSIGTGLFAGCTNLQRATFPEGITTLPTDTFSGCIWLYEFNVPTTVDLSLIHI